MRISDEKIDEIRNTNDIVEVISGYVHLKKRGKITDWKWLPGN